VTHLVTVGLDRWVPSVGEAVADWCRSWFADPLERAMLVAVVVSCGCLLLVLATRQDAGDLTSHDACVLAAVEDARAFAQVLGDERPVPVSFAERACARS
jgi:hypothetical protein